MRVHRALSAVGLCASLASCSAILGIGDLPPDSRDPDDASGDGGTSGDGAAGDSADNRTPTLIGDWVFKLATGEDEINMISMTAGHAQLYWYDSAEAQWQVSADDADAGGATLTLACTSSDCATADNIVYDCSYTLVALKCTGVSGGISNNYKGNQLTLTKQ